MTGPRGGAGGSSSHEGGGGDAVGLSVRGLVKRFPRTDRPALAGVDVAAEPGEVLALVGESGSGKTTLLRIVAGLEAPEEGVVRIGGRTVVGPSTWVRPERRGVGMVFQEFALFPHMTVRENVAFGLRSLSARERGQQVRTMLERVDLEGMGGRHPHQLSGGQRQRVALARALAPRPGLLLLDEPFSNLDAPLKVELRSRVAELLARAGVTAVLVVHEADDVFHLAGRVGVLRNGRLLQVGTPEEVYAEPRSEHVARLFGEANVLPARAVEGGVRTPLGFLACADPGTPSSRILVRPEDVLISADASDAAEAMVEEVRKRGSRYRVRLAVEAAEEGRRPILADVEGSAEGIEAGQRVGVSVRPGGFRVLPPGSTGG